MLSGARRPRVIRAFGAISGVAILIVAPALSAGLAAGEATAGAASGPSVHLVVATPTTLALGTDLAIKVTAENATNQVTTTYTGTVAFSSTDPLFVPVTSTTLTKGKGTFYSSLGTPGDQTVTVTDTVNSSITATSTPIDVVRPVAIQLPVTGDALGSVTATPDAVTPAFSPKTTNYVLACKQQTKNALTFDLTGATGGSITVGGQTGTSVDVHEALQSDQAVAISAPSAKGKKKLTWYWFRCLPPDFPVLHVTVSQTPPPGWILTGTGGGKLGHYSIITTNTGVPVWWRSTGQYDSANLQVLQNDTLGWGLGFVEHQYLYDLDTASMRTLATNAHDLYQLPDGDFIGLIWQERSGVTLTAIGDGSNQTINDCEVAEFNPQLKMVWEWDAATHISPDESTLANETGRAWTVFHCNSIDADPASPDPTNPNLLLSMRNTSGVYYFVNPEASTSAGKVLWKLGGVAPLAGSPDATAVHYVVTGDPDNGFYAQHDARFESTGQISLFDDASPPLDSSTCEHAARGLELALHPTTHTAAVTWQYAAPSGKCATFEGSFRRYDGGSDNLIAWGAATGDFISEVNASGQPLLTFSATTGDNYRALKVAPTALDVNQLRQDMGGLPPAVTAVSPSSGPAAGGTVVTLTGHGFTQASAVSFGTVAATQFTINSDESITVTAPAGTAGPVKVRVVNAFGKSKKGRASTYTYTAT
jgi:hypothetical protein